MGLDGIAADHPSTGRVALGSAAFQLPPHAEQGPSTWYLLHLHASIAMEPGTAGVATLAAATNGKGAGLVQITPGRSGVAWAAPSLAEPSPSGLAKEGAFEISLPNYLEYTGVKGGLNTLTFEASSSFGARFARIYIFGDTCIEATPVSPERLRVGVRVFPPVPQSGHDFQVQFFLKNAGTRTINGLHLSLTPADPGLRPVDGTQLTMSGLRRTWNGTLRFHATSAGVHHLRYSVGSSITGMLGGHTLTVRIGAGKSDGHLSEVEFWWILGVITTTLFGAIVAMRLRAR